ncbi:AAA family ATPase [Acinetobacter seifertii]|uniref:AAA family ATPase n=1 Tax=Acinetobacter seifertii TaxID=1530123 RepID=UPI000A30117E|nr:AAA family ATPase [Acinetobacter seifertii]OUC57558.1 SMC domain-containing protein [Acinetobacter seifertii]
MAILRKINLSNVRRFGKDIDISLSPQANIILAPNGTGKTALFEAIELALTGTVARLAVNIETSNNKNLLALVRDNENEAKVRLVFDELEYSAIVDSNGGVERTAPDWFYGDSNTKDIGYLLRLTHLLDQRDRYWFVQETSDEAGSLLSKLPLGKEALYVSDLIAGLKKSITKSIDIKSVSLENINKKIEVWNELLKQREIIKKNMGEAFLTLEQIANELSTHRNFDFLLDSIDTVTMAHSVCASDYNLKLDISRNKLLEIKNIKSIFKDYCLNLTRKNEVKVKVKDEEEVIKKLEKNINEILSEIKQNIQKYSQENIRLLEKKDILDKFKLRSSILSSLRENANLIESQNLDLLSIERVYEEEKIKFEQARKLRNKYEVLNERRIEKYKNIQDYELAQKKLSKWHIYLKEKINIINKSIELNKLYLEQEKTLNITKTKLSSSELRANEALNQLTSFKQTNDKVKAAIAEIATNISEMQNDCPLCGVNHGLEELKKRIAVKLQTMDPTLTSMTEYEQDCKRKLIEDKKNYTDALLDFNLLKERIKDISFELDIIDKKISKICIDPLFTSSDIEEVENNLKEYIQKVNREKDKLEIELKSLQSIISEDRFLELKQSFNQVEENLLDKKKVISELNNSGNSLRQNLDSLNVKLELNNVHMDSKLVENAYDKQQLIVDEIVKKKIQLESILEITKTTFKSSEISYNNSKLELENIENKIENYIGKWTNLGFNVELNEFEIEQNITKQINFIQKTKEDLIKLEKVREQIAYLRTADNFRIIQSKIDNLSHGLSEHNYQDSLLNEYSKCKKEIEYYQEKRSMVETFTKYLKEEIDEIQSTVTGIQPLWQSLLKRIIREARFSKTGLELNRRYNKSHAHVQVQISGREVLASLVASEAQKTDLQLTFLLSMALVHQWSPWKGLLLDDPTQHHDLVHASAVFDVLRDYISEYGFQIIMTTHDPVQARYFARKLKNDGIQTQLITLTPTVNGVEAITNN